MNLRKRSPYWLLLLATLGAFAGCTARPRTDYSKLELVSVRGTVRLGGQPLAGAQVVFEAEDRTFSCGITDASGAFTLKLNSEKDGVLPGTKTVRITTAVDPELDDAMMDEEGTATTKTVEQVPERFNRKSELKVDVSPSNRVFEFDLAPQ